MFWQKSLVVLGILAALGNTAPFASIRQDHTPPRNVTASLVKRLDFYAQNDDYVVFRADRRSPAEIEAAGGFLPPADFNKKKPDVSLFRHCGGADDSPHSTDDDGYVSTTADFDFAKTWLEDTLGTGVIYRIATDQNLIDCAKTLQEHYPNPTEMEFAAVQIPFDQIIGWYDQFQRRPNGGIIDAVLTENKMHNAQKYKKKDDAGARPDLAKFPDDHPAWDRDPWKDFAPCKIDEKDKEDKKDKKNQKGKTPKNKKKPGRRFVGSVVRSITSKFSSFSKAAAKTPKSTTPKSTTPKSRAPKSTALKPCTAANKKAGKCKDESKNSCARTKTPEQIYYEYRRLYKAGKLPKPDSPPTKGSKQKPGRKIGR